MEKSLQFHFREIIFLVENHRSGVTDIQKLNIPQSFLFHAVSDVKVMYLCTYTYCHEFRSKYRQIERQIKSGHSAVDFENNIKELGAQLVDLLRKENLLLMGNPLGIEFSNGFYYALSNTPEVGWHYDWEQKYKTI